MMGLETIVAMNRVATSRAKHKHRAPHVFSAGERMQLGAGDLRPLKFIPLMGDWHSKKWEVVTEHFVDSSGLGREDESALTAAGLVRKVLESDASHAYGISERGQFQLYVREYEPVQKRAKIAEPQAMMPSAPEFEP